MKSAPTAPSYFEHMAKTREWPVLDITPDVIDFDATPIEVRAMTPCEWVEWQVLMALRNGA